MDNHVRRFSTRSVNRARILDIVAEFPGIHLREIERKLGVSFNSARYHANELLKSGELVCEKQNNHSRLYPAGTTHEYRVLYSLVRDDADRKILIELCRESLSNKEISERTGLAKSTVSEHVQKLLALDLVKFTFSKGGSFSVELQKRDKIESILLLKKRDRTSDVLVRNFTELWDF